MSHVAAHNLSASPCLPPLGTCRGSYYQRAWQAVAQRALGLQHVVQPNVFSLQLPHPAAYSRDEAAWGAFKQVRVSDSMPASPGQTQPCPALVKNGRAAPHQSKTQLLTPRLPLPADGARAAAAGEGGRQRHPRAGDCVCG